MSTSIDQAKMLKLKSSLKKLQEKHERKAKVNYEWYSLRHMLSYFNWARFCILLGGREAGKSYSVTEFFTEQYHKKGIPFTWIRLTHTAAQKLLQNNAEKLVDPDIRRKYGLDLVTRGNNVYEVKREEKEVHKRDGTTEIKSEIVEKKLFARVYDLSTFYNDKGSIFDKDFLNDPNMRYHIAIDEFQRESGEKNTFDIRYALVNQLENLVRSTKDRIKIFFLGNTLEEASDILCMFNFIPEEFGIYKLKSKKCVIEYIEPSEKYLERRKESIANILMPTASTFTNKIEADTTLINKKPLVHPSYIIKFFKEKDKWFTVWDGNIVAKWNGEKKPAVAMRPYLDEVFSADGQKNIITLFDTRSFQFRNLITFKQFQSQMELLKPRK